VTTVRESFVAQPHTTKNAAEIVHQGDATFLGDLRTIGDAARCETWHTDIGTAFT
jgi:hypothetical protein